MRGLSSRFGVATFAIAALLVGAPGRALGQNVQAPPLTRAQISARFTLIPMGIGGGGTFTWNFNERHAIQTGGDFLYGSFDSFAAPAVAYTVEYRFTVPGTPARTRIFLTAGGLGLLKWSRAFYPIVVPVPFGAMPRTATDFDPTGPVYPIVGGGFERSLNRHLSVRGDGQFVFHGAIVLRFSAGVTFSVDAWGHAARRSP